MRTDNYQSEIKIVVSSAPATEPVTTAEAKTHLRIDSSGEDTLIDAYIKAARELVEAYTGRRLITRTEKLFLEFFPPASGIVIPAAPVTAVGALSYFDEDDVETVVASSTYKTDLNGHVAQVVLKSGESWPSLPSNVRPVNPIQQIFTSGYATAAAIPESLKLAVKLLVGHMYENREATTPLTVTEIPLGIRYILAPYRVWEVF